MILTFAQKENIGFQYVLDTLRPCSPYGQERLRDLQPMGPHDRAEIQRQLNNIQSVLSHPECRMELQQLQRIFMGLKMIRPTAKKCLEADLNAIELFEIKRFLLQTEEMLPLFASIQPILQPEGIFLQNTHEALRILDPEGNRTASFHLSDAMSPALAQVRLEKRALEAQIRENATPELLTRRSQLAGEEELEEMRIQAEMSRALRPHIPAILSNMDAIADLDLTVEKARIAQIYGASCPHLTENTLELVDMVNPRIAELLKSQGKTFTPVSIALQPGATVITGANMGGKSVALKTIALNILLVHCGFFPFAASARIPLFDALHIISEDLESIDRGLSSFGGEMVRFTHMTQQLAQGFHFILLDEFARGTNPSEGAAIVRSVTKYLNGQPAISVLVTHFDHVADAAIAHYQVAGLRDLDWEKLEQALHGVSAADGARRITSCMNYGLFPVLHPLDCPRDALHICRLLGMPGEIVEDAEKTMSSAPEFC